MKLLNTTVPLGNANRWRVEKATPYDEHSRLVIFVQLINNGNALVSEMTLNVENYDAGANPPTTEKGKSDRVSINTSTTVISAALQIEPRVLNLPTGYTDGLAAWKAGGTLAQRREALETWMLTAGVAGANLAGT